MKLFTFSFFILLLFNCTNENNKNETYSLMGSKHYFILDTRNAVNPFSENIRYKNDKLYYVNNFSNELIIYNFPTGNINNRITFEKKGPNGIGTIRGVYPYSMDSIFLISGTYIHQFFLSDTTGILKNKYTVPPLDNKEIAPCIRPLFSIYFNEAKVKGNKINLSTYYPIGGENPNNKLPKEILNFSFNLKTEKVVGSSFYPNFDRKTRARLTHFSRTFNKDKCLYSFMHLDNIYIQGKHENYTQKRCKSKFRTKSLDQPSNLRNPIIQQMTQKVENPYYISIIYDKYRDVTYRYFYPGIKLKESEDPRKLFENKKKFSIMLLDKNYDVIGETMMPENTYNPKMSFIAEDGLYLALHCDHPKYNPDSLTFERIDLNPINKN